MRRSRWIGCLALFGLVLGADAGAVGLGLGPALQNPSGSYSLELTAFGLGSGVAPSVGGFDVTLAFDPLELQLLDVAFSAALGASLTAEFSNPGSIRALAVSLLLPAQLDALQGAEVPLASFEFELLGGAPAEIAISVAKLSDGFGKALTIDAVRNGTVGAIPEPGAAASFALGLLVIWSCMPLRRQGSR